MVIGVGAAGAAGAADGCAEASGGGCGRAAGRRAAAGATGWARRRDADDEVARSASTLPIRPIVETGIFVPSPVTWPDGKVRLFAARTPVDLRDRDDVRLGELRRVERDRALLLLAAA